MLVNPKKGVGPRSAPRVDVQIKIEIKIKIKINVNINIKINTKIKGGGQECPPCAYPISMPPFTLSTCPVM